MSPFKHYYSSGFEPQTGPVVDPRLLLFLDASESTSYPGSGSTWSDLTSGGNDFTLNGGYSFQASPAAVELEGTNEFAELSTGLGVFDIQEFTIIIWFYYTTLDPQFALWSYDQLTHSSPFYSQHIRLQNGNVVTQWNNGSSIGGLVANPGLSAGNWYQLVFCYESGNQRIYINDTLEASATNPHTITYLDKEVWIGKNNFEPNPSGKFAIIQFWDEALSASDVTDNYDTYKSRFGLS